MVLEKVKVLFARVKGHYGQGRATDGGPPGYLRDMADQRTAKGGGCRGFSEGREKLI